KVQIHLTWFVKVYLLPLIGSNEVVNAFKSSIEYHAVGTKLIYFEENCKNAFSKIVKAVCFGGGKILLVGDID
ncbi:hypothetical protein VIGAN_06170400, partial [Vigna angularis var. angularis]